MRILQVSAYLHPDEGGSQRYCYQLSQRLAQRGHEVHIVTSKLDRNLPSEQEKDGLHIHRCFSAGKIWRTNPATVVIHKLVNIKADVIHSHSYIFLTSNQAALARKLVGTPFLLHLHGGLDYSPLTNDFSAQLRFHFKNAFYDPTVGKWTIEAADAVGCISKTDKKLAKNKWNINEEKLYWAPNAISSREFYRRNSGDTLNVVFIGRAEAWKGIRVFLEVVELVRRERPDVNFFIVGEGSHKAPMRFKSSNEHMRSLGPVPHEIIPKVLSRASVLVLPSYTEGLPTVCLEALASGVPVVASRIGGLPEVVIDGRTGYLFPPGNAELSAERVLDLLSDEQLRRRMGNRGRRLVQRHYTWDTVVKKIERIYESIRLR